MPFLGTPASLGPGLRTVSGANRRRDGSSPSREMALPCRIGALMDARGDAAHERTPWRIHDLRWGAGGLVHAEMALWPSAKVPIPASFPDYFADSHRVFRRVRPSGCEGVRIEKVNSTPLTQSRERDRLNPFLTTSHAVLGHAGQPGPRAENRERGNLETDVPGTPNSSSSAFNGRDSACFELASGGGRRGRARLATRHLADPRSASGDKRERRSLPLGPRLSAS